MSQQPTPRRRRREKLVVSCNFCRARKSRCDRQTPCSTCAKHGRAADCVYVSTEYERRSAVDYRPARSQQASQRVAHLESLVTQMRDQMLRVTQQVDPSVSDGPPLPKSELDQTPASPPLSSKITDDMGKLSVKDDQLIYTGNTHWVNILEDIQIIKDELSDVLFDTEAGADGVYSDTNSPEAPSDARMSLLNCHPSISQEQILAMLPPRRVVDRHVFQFFNEFDFAPFVLHRSRFLAEYSNFWVDPSAAPIVWLGLLFSLMSISACLQMQGTSSSEPHNTEMQASMEVYRTLTIHCLITGDYLHPRRYTIETLTLHFALENQMNVDAPMGSWTLIGLIIRLALRVGLHRDPSHWPEIPPLEAEFRRRLWIILYHMDFFTSTKVGLPRIINDTQCDTRPPANLFDDIVLEQGQVPLETPLSHVTPLSYVIQRHLIISVAAEIYDATEAGSPTPATIAALSTKLQTASASIPPESRFKSPHTLVTDNSVKLLHRILIDILINKAVYLLHRRGFMRGPRVEWGHDSSHRLCIDAALDILAHQRTLDEETQPGGIMSNIRWRATSSLEHEFLQATTMLCYAWNVCHNTTESPTPSVSMHRRDDVLDTLLRAQKLWAKEGERSHRAQRASKTIKVILEHDGETTSTAGIITDSGRVEKTLDDCPGRSTAPSDYAMTLDSLDYSSIFGFDLDVFGNTVLPETDPSIIDVGGLWDDLMVNNSMTED